MKKILTLAAALTLFVGATAQSSWRVGITGAMLGNQSHFSGGQSDASALFTPQKYGTPALGVTFQKKLCSHMTFQTGLSFSSLGFQYGMAKNYSLLQPMSHYMINRVSMGTTTIPVSLLWNFKPNCKNVHWFVGAGLSLVAINSVSNASNSVQPANGDIQSGLAPGDYINQTVSLNSNLALNGHFLAGVEKTFKSGRAFNVAFYFNRGFSPVATSNVNYSVNGQAYNHTFTNYNRCAGLTFSYFFKAFGTRAAQNAALKAADAVK